jgi:hypothetical protein
MINKLENKKVKPLFCLHLCLFHIFYLIHCIYVQSSSFILRQYVPSHPTHSRHVKVPVYTLYVFLCIQIVQHCNAGHSEGKEQEWDFMTLWAFSNHPLMESEWQWAHPKIILTLFKAYLLTSISCTWGYIVSFTHVLTCI